jgi:threonine/homoserine/homoserine lactone efflux protein
VIPLITQLAAFAGTAALVIVTPGPDTAVTLGSTLSGGRAAGVSTAFGVLSGQAVWTLASSTGLSALLLASQPVFAAVRYTGAAYLVFLGLQALRAALRNDARELSGLAANGLPERRGRLTCFRRGLLSDLGNPKMAVFFASMLPQFGSHFAALALLGLVFCAMTFTWLACYALAVAHIGGLLRRSPVRRALEATTGAALVIFAVRLAAEHP